LILRLGKRDSFTGKIIEAGENLTHTPLVIPTEFNGHLFGYAYGDFVFYFLPDGKAIEFVYSLRNRQLTAFLRILFLRTTDKLGFIREFDVADI